MKRLVVLLSCVWILTANHAKAQDVAKSPEVDSGAGDAQRYSVQPITAGEIGSAILVDHKTGFTWILRVTPGQTSGFSWLPLPVQSAPKAN